MLLIILKITRYSRLEVLTVNKWTKPRRYIKSNHNKMYNLIIIKNISNTSFEDEYKCNIFLQNRIYQILTEGVIFMWYIFSL